ncbi:unnamed protein product (macronuclear) [Paramecium tetraurelia]|uniref:Uncharacterized protein n=1 Tax=Paramecium tetraurelia TaxID=5888 RepID=A0CBJ1_PARTE|nr:uncharacterized protein GSPATT00036941001 [Paramecium tetraurelia]CAK68158.1 unnamed protein product [Paramecium tetraurelia]|eukprot:XP_001435555.1 hypothetical protein (macronuclear) [Paramecium tetraurelia strain d4-2]
MNIAEQIALKKYEFNKQMEQRDIIQEMDDHLKNLHESDDDRSFYQMQYDQKDIQKLITIMLKYYSRQEGQTYQTKKCFYFYIWKYFQNQDIFEKNWEIERKDLEKQKRYPYRNMKKQRKYIEEQIFDLERKNFFQYRQKQILIQLFKNAARKERLIKTIAFHRFIRNASLMNYSSTSKYNTNQNTFKSTVTQQNNVFYQKENKQKSRSKSPISNNNSKVSLSTKSLNSRNRAVFKMLIYLQKVDDKLKNKVSLYFYKWIKIIMQVRQLEQIEEINSINLILNQQVFKESVLRTQIQLIKSEIDSKTYLAQELLNQLLK